MKFEALNLLSVRVAQNRDRTCLKSRSRPRIHCFSHRKNGFYFQSRKPGILCDSSFCAQSKFLELAALMESAKGVSTSRKRSFWAVRTCSMDVDGARAAAADWHWQEHGKRRSVEAGYGVSMNSSSPSLLVWIDRGFWNFSQGNSFFFWLVLKHSFAINLWLWIVLTDEKTNFQLVGSVEWVSGRERPNVVALGGAKTVSANRPRGKAK